MRKQVQIINQGMNQDLSESTFDPKYAFENKNIRITANDSNTLLAVTNEKGTSKKIDLKTYLYSTLSDVEKAALTQQGVTIDNINIAVLGHATFEDKMVLFVKYMNPFKDSTDYTIHDYILNIVINKDSVNITTIVKADLNFVKFKPIETLPFYENESIQKVYFTDGYNQPRMVFINRNAINHKSIDYNTYPDLLNFVNDIDYNIDVDIQRNTNTNGVFPAGSIQYAFTYHMKYGQESNIKYISTLHYTGHDSRGGSPEETLGNSFTLTIKPENINKFDYIRVYSIIRTSIDATPTVKLVTDLALTSDTLIYTDYNTTGSTVDPSLLKYIGGENISAETMASKDNTLFLGNIKLKRQLITTGPNIRNLLASETSFVYSENQEQVIPKSDYYFNANTDKPNKIFKYQEWYRLGIQFQHKTGKWSEPIFVKDIQNDKIIKTEISDTSTGILSKYSTGVPKLSLSLFGSFINDLKNIGYTKVRPIVVYPELSDRTCLAQGIVCPTVFNVGDRTDNSPYAQASWFARPQAPYNMPDTVSLNLLLADTFKDIKTKTPNSINSRRALTSSEVDPSAPFDLAIKGAAVEFRHNVLLNAKDSRANEIQSLDIQDLNFTTIESPNYKQFYLNSLIDINTHDSDGTIVPKEKIDNIKKTITSKSAELYGVDQSIVTLNSPDIEFDNTLKSMDTSSFKFRILGIVPINASHADLELSTSTVSNFYNNDKNQRTPGFYHRTISNKMGDRHSWKTLSSSISWLDEYTNPTKINDNNINTGFLVYPWHRQGSLNNTIKKDSEGVKSATLKHKTIANYKYSIQNFYFKNITDTSKDAYNPITDDIQLFDFNSPSLIRLKSNQTEQNGSINYYGNIDKIANAKNISLKSSVVEVTNPTEISAGNYSFKDSYWIDDPQGHGGQILETKYWKYITASIETSNKFSILSTKLDAAAIENNNNLLYENTLIGVKNTDTKDSVDTSSNFVKTSDPTSIKYKSTPHMVIALHSSNSKDGLEQTILPCIGYDNDIQDPSNTKPLEWSILINEQRSQELSTINSKPYYIWGKDKDRVTQRILNEEDYSSINLHNSEYAGEGPGYGFLYLGEIYRDKSLTLFGGTSEEAKLNNKWIPCGNTVNLNTSNTVIWNRGDTYYQRYDCLKTYPYSKEDTNSLIDVVSFMCETRINIDGRYDKNRGQTNNFTITPENFNLVNKVYSQIDNYFTYRSIDSERFSLDNFNNSITWTKEKTLGESKDTWTNVTMTNTLDVDGNLGAVSSLNILNNELYCFQPKGISNLLFNSRVQIPTSDGVPIEITNGLKMQGKRYLSNKIGTGNKHSIIESPNGLYFIDEYNKDLYLFNKGLKNLSATLGFNSWFKKNVNIGHWDTYNSSNVFRGFYDSINKDIYYSNKDTCISYSEIINKFVSFYDYIDVEDMFTFRDHFYSFKNKIGWEHFTGDYNMFYDKFKPFYTTLLINPEMNKNKVFNNMEFRADFFDNKDTYLPEESFDNLKVWNEYQMGEQSLNKQRGIPSNLKKKFRIWRANIPRDSINNRDRIRNPWIYLKLEKNNINTNKATLHDVIVNYYD